MSEVLKAVLDKKQVAPKAKDNFCMKLLPNKTLFKIHSWLGLNTGLLLFVICFSGSIAVISNEIDWLLDPVLRVEGKDQPYAWEAMYRNVREKYPDAEITFISQQKNSFTEVGDYFAASVLVPHPEKGLLKVHLDPYTGEILGENGFLDVQRFFRGYHTQLFSGIVGDFIVMIFAFFLLTSVLTGFLFYKNWFKNLFKLRLKKGLRVIVADSHRLAGVWSLVFALIIALTGIWYLGELVVSIGGNYEILDPPKADKIGNGTIRQLGDAPEWVSLDLAVQNAEKAIPNYRVESFTLPKQPDEYIVMYGQDGNTLTRDRTNQVHINPYTGEVARVQKASDLTTLQVANQVIDPLHFGTFGGLVVKIIWFIFGLILSVSILAGTYIWYLRNIKKLESKLEKANTHQAENETVNKSKRGSARYSKMGRSMIIWNSISIFILVATALITALLGFKFYGGYPTGYYATVEEVTLDAWPVEISCTYPCTLEKGTKLIAAFKTADLPNYDSLKLNFYTDQGDTLSIPADGMAKLAEFRLNQEASQVNVSRLELEVLKVSGGSVRQPISIEKIDTQAINMEGQFDSPPSKWSYQDVPARIYFVIGVFSVLLIAIITTWCRYMLRAVNKEKRLLGLLNV